MMHRGTFSDRATVAVATLGKWPKRVCETGYSLWCDGLYIAPSSGASPNNNVRENISYIYTHTQAKGEK